MYFTKKKRIDLSQGGKIDLSQSTENAGVFFFLYGGE
jgi:hypothetical protein